MAGGDSGASAAHLPAERAAVAAVAAVRVVGEHVLPSGVAADGPAAGQTQGKLSAQYSASLFMKDLRFLKRRFCTRY